MPKDQQRPRGHRPGDHGRPPMGGAISDAGPIPHRIGSTVRPSRHEPLSPIFDKGWSDVDDGGFVWIEGPAGDLIFDLPVLMKDLVVEIECFPLPSTAAAPQRIAVYANGAYLDSFLVTERGQVSAAIPRELCPGRRLRVSIVPALVHIPKREGGSADERALSIGVHAIGLGYDHD